MSKLVLTDGDGGGGVPALPGDPKDAETVEPMRLPPLRKFAVARRKMKTVIVTGHSLEPIGANGIAIVEYRQVGDKVLQTYPRIFGEFLDVEELETNSLKLN